MHDDEEPRKKKPELVDLTKLSVEELLEHILFLESEIVRTRGEIERKTSAQRAADLFFKKNRVKEREMKTLSGKAAIVTGSTSGIGEGIAKCFAEAGADVMLNGFGDAAEIEKLRAGMEKQYGVRVRYHNSDMSKPADVVDLVKTTEKEFGKVDILVNNAGIQFVAPIEEFPVEKWDAIIAINLSSAFHSIRTAIPGMKQRKWGRIINVASAHGLVASAEKSAYVTSKHGIVGLTKVVALENAGKGITCNAICPGWVLTPLVQKQIDAKAAEGKISVEQAKINLLSEKQPSKEFVHVEELGALAVFLCSDAAHNMTGTTLSMDGGWTAQ